MIYGAEGGRPRKLAVGEEARRAQSRGECPGSSWTFRRGFAGIEECVAGGRSDDDEAPGGPRLGRGERRGGAISPALGWGLRRGGPRVPPDARCAEFSAGKEGAVGSSLSSAESPAPRVRVGMDGVGEATAVRAWKGYFWVGFLMGREGGGMALRSSSAFSRVGSGASCVDIEGFSSSTGFSRLKVGGEASSCFGATSCLCPPSCFFATSCNAGRSHLRKAHSDGGHR